MKELDVLLEHYLAHGYATADEAQRKAFAELLELQDPELAAHLLHGVMPEDPVTADVVRQIRARD